MDDKLLNSYLDNKKNTKKRLSKLITKILICFILFFIISIFAKVNDSYKDVIHKYLFEKNFDFISFNEVYSSITKKETKTKAVSNEIFTYISKEKYLNGEKYILDSESPIKTFADGIVVFIGDKENLGNTLILQTSNGYDIWYSGLEFNDVTLYDYVKSGTIIASGDKIILTIVKDNNYFTYEEYQNKNS